MSLMQHPASQHNMLKGLKEACKQAAPPATQQPQHPLDAGFKRSSIPQRRPQTLQHPKPRTRIQGPAPAPRASTSKFSNSTRVQCADLRQTLMATSY